MSKKLWYSLVAVLIMARTVLSACGPPRRPACGNCGDARHD